MKGPSGAVEGRVAVWPCGRRGPLEAVCGHQRPSGAVGGHRRPSGANGPPETFHVPGLYMRKKKNFKFFINFSQLGK